jgi:hypothetical protein
MTILGEEGADDKGFQQDGMLPHFHKKAMDFLNYKFPENVIGL